MTTSPLSLPGGIVRIVANLIWLFFSLFVAIGWVFSGLLLCVTLIGIPFGLQCFKLARLSLWPFGYDVRNASQQVGCLSTGLNVIWLLPGVVLALGHLLTALVLCIFVITIPFAMQHLKLAKLALMPFGREVYKT